MSAGKRVDTAAVDLAEGVPAALAILVDRAQLSASDVTRLLLDPGAVRPGRYADPRRLSTVPWNPRATIASCAASVAGCDTARRIRSQTGSVSQARFPVLPTASANIFACYG